MNDPIYILGTGRSGTTILAKLLGYHPELLFIDEPRFLIDIIYAFQTKKIDRDEALLRMEILKNGSGKEPMKFLRRIKENYPEITQDCYENIELGTKTLINSFLSTNADLSFSKQMTETNNLIHNISKITCNNIKGNRFLIKEPYISLYLDWVQSVFPNSKYIHIVRNPFDVISSRVERGFQGTFQEAFDVWFTRLESILKYQNEYREKVYCLYFEDFISNPKQTIKNVYQFIEINANFFDQNCLAEVTFDKANINRANNKFNKLQIATIKKGIKELNAISPILARY